MEQNQTVEELIRDCISFLEHHCYSQYCIRNYKMRWKNGVCKYMLLHGITIYNRSVGESFIDSCMFTTITSKEKQILRSVHVLNEMQETGKITRRTPHPIIRKLEGSIGEAIQSLLISLKELRLSEITINSCLLNLFRFQEYLKNQEVFLLEHIKEEHILSFVSTQINSKAVPSLRKLFRFLLERKMIEKDLAYVLADYKHSRREKIPSFYASEEIKQIETSIVRSNSTGKRNYAILLLATRLGLRVSDIVNLSFSNLNWENSQIILRQVKTGKGIELPLLLEVGEALIDYLRYGRPKSALSNIFLSSNAPYTTMSRQGVADIIRTIIGSSGITIGERKCGPHSMRYSLASRLLENNISLPVISETLGHMNTDSTMVYLRIDVNALRKCSLDVPNVDIDFYNQKGGRFYA